MCMRFSVVYDVCLINCGLISWLNEVLFRKPFPTTVSQEVLPIFSSSFSILSFKLRVFFVSLELIFMQYDIYRFQFPCSACGTPVSQHHLLQTLSFLQCMFLISLSNIGWLQLWALPLEQTMLPARATVYLMKTSGLGIRNLSLSSRSGQSKGLSKQHRISPLPLEAAQKLKLILLKTTHCQDTGL